MAIKRYAEYRESAIRRGPPPTASRSPTTREERLIVSIMFYGSSAMLFLGAFVMRYRLELILAFPLVSLVMAIYSDAGLQARTARYSVRRDCTRSRG